MKEQTTVDYKLVGIGGMPRSGKDTVAELLMNAGYMGVSFGDIVREYCFDRHKDKPDPISVANMTDTSNWLRETYGPDVILREALKRFEAKRAEGEHYEGLVLFSVRAPIEVDFILEHGGELLWIDADDAVRHQRNNANLRKGELPVTLEEFKASEALQWQPQPGIPKEVQMDLAYVKDHATQRLVNNNADREAFLADARQLFSL
jgi:dephospho-CoA kinase